MTPTVRFITFEGIEGCGKTTQVGRLARLLTAQGRDHIRTREPGGTRLGEALRPLLVGLGGPPPGALTELLLYVAARAQHLAEVIEPALAAGRIVLCDRFKDASLAYQAWGRGLDAGLVDALHALPGLARVPDRTLILDVPVEVGLKRARIREAGGQGAAESRYEAEPLAFHRRVREGYLALARSHPDRIVVIDASGDEDSVAGRVLEDLAPRLGLRR